MLITSISMSVYLVALHEAYSDGNASLVFPIVRSSPLLIIIWSTWLFSESLVFYEVMGIFISICGLICLGLIEIKNTNLNTIIWAVVAAIACSIYPITDAIAMSVMQTSTVQLGYISVVYAIAFFCLSVKNYINHGYLIPKKHPPIIIILIGGFTMGMSYYFLLTILNYIPPAHAISYSNLSIVIVVIISMLFLKERHAWKAKTIALSFVIYGLVIVSHYI